MSAALAPAHQEVVAGVRQAPVKYVDETGWKQAGRKRWLWAAATTPVAVFLIDVFRNVTALRKLLGPTLSRDPVQQPLSVPTITWSCSNGRCAGLTSSGG